MDLLYQTLEASADHHHVTSDGEEWRIIGVPGFRRTYHEKAWVYASSLGRLLSNDLRVFESKNLEAYQTTTVTLFVDGGLGKSRVIRVHRIIAFTFLGPPSDPSYTVDHINQQRGDNRAVNLRWADTRTQMENREMTLRRFVDQDGQRYESVVELHRALGASHVMVDTAVRGTDRGDRVHIGDCIVRVVSVTRKKMTTKKSEYKPYNHRTVKVTADVRVLNKFLDGMTMSAIMDDSNLRPNTVCNYLKKALRASKAQKMDRFARITGLDCRDMRRQLGEEVDALKAQQLKGQDFLDAYKTMVLNYLPHLDQDNWIAPLAGLRPLMAFYGDVREDARPSAGE